MKRDEIDPEILRMRMIKLIVMGFLVFIFMLLVIDKVRSNLNP